jgi:hypothetical protein
MRKIEEKMAAAIREGREWREGNTSVQFTADGQFSVRLHGNEIAWGTTKAVRLSSRGWHTSTTKSRLNAVLQAVGFPGSVYQTKGEWKLWQSPASMAGRSVNPSMDFHDGICVYV